MKRRWPPTVAQGVAAIATLLSLLAITAYPAVFRAPVEFSPSIALEWGGFVALIWAAAFAADNLIELRRARIAELTPLVDVRPEVSEEHRTRLLLHVRNVGKGAAIGLRVAAWWKDPDLLEWFPQEAKEMPDILISEERATGFALMSYGTPWEFDDDPVKLIIETKFEDPENRGERSLAAWGLRGFGEQRRFVRLDEQAKAILAASRGKKREALQDALDSVRDLWNLGPEWILEGDVDRALMTAILANKERGIHLRETTTVHAHVGQIPDSIEEALRKKLPRHEWPLAYQEVADAPTEEEPTE